MDYIKECQYEERFIAFIDILGFRNIISESINSPEVLQDIIDSLEYVYEEREDNYNGKLAQSFIGRMISTFSDSMIISYPCSLSGAGYYILLDLVFITNDLINIGMMLRGGLTVGKVIHTEKYSFGPAMNRAYELESKVAVYPRIIVDSAQDKNVIKEALKNPLNEKVFEEKYLDKVIRKDEDGLCFVDFLNSSLGFDDEMSRNEQVKRVIDFADSGRKKYTNDLRIKSKYEWLYSYSTKS